MNQEEAILSTFLFYGYFPKSNYNLLEQPWAQYAVNPEIQNAYRNSLISIKETDLVLRGESIFRRMFSNIPKGTHIVPLSGGMDSRCILGGLLSAGVKSDITAITYGTPGSLDYEIPALICKKAGVRHERMDLTKIALPRDFSEITANSEQWLFFDSPYRKLITSKFGIGSIYWSGFMGDVLAGAFSLPFPSQSWDTACNEFVRYNRFVESVSLWHPDFQPESVLPSMPIFEGELLNFDDQLDFTIRMMSYTKPINIQQPFNWQMPLLNSEWVYFILSVPYRYRVKEVLYRRILERCYPGIFSLPTKNSYGLSIGSPEWLIRLQRKFINMGFRTCATILALAASGTLLSFMNNKPMVNYIDFDETLRSRKDANEFILSCIMDLIERRVIGWLDVESLWNQHMDKICNHGTALFLLAALELNLKRSQGKLPQLCFRPEAFQKHDT